MDFFSYILLFGLLVTAAGIDLATQKIPNKLTFPVITIALSFHTATAGFEGLLFSLGGIVVGIALLIVPYLMGGMGAGDAKLMGAVGAIIGAKSVFFTFLFSAIAGGVYAIISGGSSEKSRPLLSIFYSFENISRSPQTPLAKTSHASVTAWPSHWARVCI